MSPRSVRTLVLTLCGCASTLACERGASQAQTPPASSTASTPEANADPTPEANADPSPEPAVAAPEQRPPIEPGALVYFVGEQLWRIEGEGAAPLDLGLKLGEAPDGGMVSTGGKDPAASADGRWLAYIDGVDLWLAALSEGSEARALTKMPPAKDEFIVAAEISFSEWSPDSSTLVVFLTEPGYLDDDPLPLPEGLAYGAHVVRADAPTLDHAPHIEGYMGWTPDSKAVLDNHHVDAADYELREYPIAPGAAQVRRETAEGYGFAQLRVSGSHLAWVSSGAGKTSQVMVAPIAGGPALARSPARAFADIQWPIPAPDGERVVFELNGVRVLGVDASEPTPLALGSGPLRWFDAERIATVTDEGLVLVGLDGKTEVLDPKATKLVR